MRILASGAMRQCPYLREDRRAASFGVEKNRLGVVAGVARLTVGTLPS